MSVSTRRRWSEGLKLPNNGGFGGGGMSPLPGQDLAVAEGLCKSVRAHDGDIFDVVS